EYSQWRERFMNYLIEKTDGEAMINSIQNGDYLLPVVAQVDSNDTTKDLWDALERQMHGSEYGEQDRKVVILYEYETFKATEGEQLLDTYLRYLQVINDLKKCGYKKDNYELNYKFLNNLQPEWKQYGTLMRQTKNLMDINIDALYNILKQNQGDVNDALGYKKKAVVVTSDPLALADEKTKKPKYVKSVEKKEDKKEDKKADEKKRDMSKVKCYNCKKEGHFAKDCKKAKVKDYNYYKKKMLLAKKDSDEEVLLAKDQAWIESSSNSDQEINANMVFMAKMEKVLSDLDESSSSAKETIAEKAKKMLLAKKDSDEEVLLAKDQAWIESSSNSDQEINANMVFMAKMEKVLSDLDESSSSAKETIAEKIFHDAIESASENFNENHIVSQKECDESEVDYNDSEEKDHLVDKLIEKFNYKIAKYLDTLSSVRRPKHNGVIWKKKGSSNTFNVDLSYVSPLKLNKDVKRYSRKDLLSCNNSYLGDTSSAYDCNNAMNVSCNSRLYDSFDENDLFIFDDVSVRNSQVSKMPFRKKPRDSLNVRSKSHSNKSFPRTVHRWLPKMQLLAEPVDKWIPKVNRCSKHMTGNRALLINFVEKFFGTVRFGNNDFMMIAGYGDVVIGSICNTPKLARSGILGSGRATSWINNTR
nr:hypothetical protein [Tanacetum cinerariifolium]